MIMLRCSIRVMRKLVGLSWCVLAPSVPQQPANHIRTGNVFRLDVMA